MPLKLPATSMPKPLNKLGYKVIGNWCARFGGMGGPYRGSKGLHNWLAKSSLPRRFAGCAPSILGGLAALRISI